MDERFGAFDALTREQLQDELLRIQARTRVTAIFVTHSVEEATLLADRVIVMTAVPAASKPISPSPSSARATSPRCRCTRSSRNGFRPRIATPCRVRSGVYATPE
jgi:ABC-type nitrate/sulfonate/bicarbonate transport system ATPase subunit